MRKFKVLVIALALTNNAIAKFGDVVDEDKLTAPILELVNGGYIELVETEIDTNDSEEAEKKRLADEQDAVNAKAAEEAKALEFQENQKKAVDEALAATQESAPAEETTQPVVEVVKNEALPEAHIDQQQVNALDPTKILNKGKK